MKLGELCLLFTDGDWIESKDQSDSGIRLIQTGNIGNGEFLYKNDKAKYISEDTFKRLNCTEVFPDDILISRLPEPVGRGCIIPDIGERMITAVDCTICRVNEKLIDRKYFCYFLESNTYKTQLEQHVTGTTRKRISRKNLSSVEIDIPEQAKQKEVVYKLDRLKKIIQNYNRELDLLDELVRARFVEMFGDPIENTYSFPILKLGELSELITKGASPSWQGYSYTSDSTQTLFVTSENVREGYMDFSSIKYVEDAFNEKQKRSMIQKGDYLINIVGASIGRAAQFNMDCKANMNQAAALVRIKDNTISDNYLLYYLNSDKAQMMYNSMKSDTGRANLSLQDIANLEILVPDLTLQVKFASFVEEIDKSRSRIQKSLEASQELFDSLMQEYFG